jgi:CheY-like chemotaxis protein
LLTFFISDFQYLKRIFSLASCLHKVFLLLLNQGRMVVTCQILVVDDDQRTREALVEILRKAGYGVVSLTSGDGVEELINRYNFSGAIIDYHLPVRNGLEIAESLRKKLPSCRVILISSEYQPKSQPFTMTMVDRFLAKPFSKTTLLKAVTELCPLDSSPTG